MQTISEHSLHCPNSALRKLLGGAGQRLLAATPYVAAVWVILPLAGVLDSALGVFDDPATLLHLWQTTLPRYLIDTAYLGVLTVFSALLLGLGAALIVSLLEFPGRRVFEVLLILPLAAPSYVIAYAYTDFLDHAGPLQTWMRSQSGMGMAIPDVRSVWGAAIILALVLYPYVYLLVRAALLERSPSMIDAARTLGCSALGAVWRVLLPVARPAVVAGGALVLMETLADFGTVSYFAVQTFSTGIFRAWLSLGDQAGASFLAAVLLVFVLGVLAIERYARGRARYVQAPRRGQAAARKRVSGLWVAIPWLACLIPVVLGFALPATLLIRLALSAPQEDADSEGLFALWDPRLLDWAGNSVMLAAVSALLIVAVAILAAYAVRWLGASRPSLRTALRIAGAGYAIPGLVVAVGSLMVLGGLQGLGLEAGAWVGSLSLLVYAYFVRFFAAGLAPVEAGLMRISPTIDDSARALGCTPLEALRRVHAPIMWRSTGLAFLLVFVDVVKELPASLVLRPFNFDTLAITAHHFAADERLAHAAAPALMIVIVGLIPLVLLNRVLLARH